MIQDRVRKDVCGDELVIYVIGDGKFSCIIKDFLLHGCKVDCSIRFLFEGVVQCEDWRLLTSILVRRSCLG